MSKLDQWIRDYIHLGRGYAREIFWRKPPKHYLEYIEAGKVPVILIPGVFTTWRFLKQIFDNHVQPIESCRLDGTRNIQLEEHGHHAMLASKRFQGTILEIIG